MFCATAHLAESHLCRKIGTHSIPPQPSQQQIPILGNDTGPDRSVPDLVPISHKSRVLTWMWIGMDIEGILNMGAYHKKSRESLALRKLLAVVF